MSEYPEDVDGTAARERLISALSRAVYILTPEEALVAGEELDTVLAMFRSTVRILVRTREDRRMEVSRGDPGSFWCPRCTTSTHSNPDETCACLFRCMSMWCQGG